MKNYAILLLLIASVQGQIPKLGQCPSVKVIDNFDLKRFAGLWYEIEKYLWVFSLGGKCATVNYEINDNNDLNITYHFERFEINETLEGLARAISPPGCFGVSFDKIPYQPEFHYTVLYTDYDMMSVLYCCNNIYDMFHEQTVWILARSLEITQDLIIHAYKVLNDNRISTDYLIKSDNDC